MKKLAIFSLLAVLAASLLSAQAATLNADQKSKVEQLLGQLKTLGTDPVVVKAVKDYNAAPPAEAQGLTQAKWDELSVLSPEIRYFAKNALAEACRCLRCDVK